MIIMQESKFSSTTSLAILSCPVFILFQSLPADRRSNALQAIREILQANWPNLIHTHTQECFTQAPKRTHSRILRQSRDI